MQVLSGNKKELGKDEAKVFQWKRNCLEGGILCLFPGPGEKVIHSTVFIDS